MVDQDADGVELRATKVERCTLTLGMVDSDSIVVEST